MNISEGWSCAESAFRLLQEAKHPALHERPSVGENFQHTTNTAGRHEQQATKSSRCAGGIYSGRMKTTAAMWVSSQEAVRSSGASGFKLGIVQSSRLSKREISCHVLPLDTEGRRRDVAWRGQSGEHMVSSDVGEKSNCWRARLAGLL